MWAKNERDRSVMIINAEGAEMDTQTHVGDKGGKQRVSTNREFIERWFRRVWTEEDESAIFEMLAEDASMGGLEHTRLHGPKEVLMFHRLLRQQFTDFNFTMERSVEQEDRVAMSMTIECIEKATGEKITTFGQILCVIRDGKIAEGDNLVDFISMFEQTGRLPDRTLDYCLINQPIPFRLASVV